MEITKSVGSADAMGSIKASQHNYGEVKTLEGPTVEELYREHDEIRTKALNAYSYAASKCEKNLMSAHPVRLSCALNFAVFKYEYMDEKQEAIAYLNKAVEVALKRIDNVKDEQDKEDSETILELMRENIT